MPQIEQKRKGSVLCLYPFTFPKTISVTARILSVLHHSHSVILILEMLRERVLFVTLILVLKKKLAQKKSDSEFKTPQVTVVPYFSMLAVCTLFSEW